MKKTPGRPPLDDDDPSVDVHVRMPGKQYDDTFARSKRDRVSVPEIIRRDLCNGAKKKSLK
jgi:hypothetical protein